MKKVKIEWNHQIKELIIPDTGMFFYLRNTDELFGIKNMQEKIYNKLVITKVSNSFQSSTDIVLGIGHDFFSIEEEYFLCNPLRKEYLDLCQLLINKDNYLINEFVFNDSNYVEIGAFNYELRALEKLSNI
jgi:hypothetical protein